MGAGGVNTGSAAASLAAYACAARESGLPTEVIHEAERCLLNFIGCAIGGASHDVVRITDRSLSPFAGPTTSSVIGQRRRVDPLLASLLNGAAASAHSFDDTHAEAVVHPGAPVCAAALAVAQQIDAQGGELLTAIALGVEATCRLSKAISVAPAIGDIAWYQTGITGGTGAAIAAGTLLHLDPQQMRNAIGIAVAQASGMRIMQGSMTMLMLAGHAAQSGVRAALLAREGFESPAASLDGPHGFAAVFSKGAHIEALTVGLGHRFESLANTYKAYPCGVVLHPVVDACFELRAHDGFDAEALREIRIRLHPMALALTDRRQPATRTEAQVSVHHWAAVALALGRAGLPEGELAVVRDPAIAALRERVHPLPDEKLARDEAEVTIVLDGGRTLSSALHKGVAPMSDDALAAKFRAQALLQFPPAHVEQLLDAIRALAATDRPDALAALTALI